MPLITKRDGLAEHARQPKQSVLAASIAAAVFSVPAGVAGAQDPAGWVDRSAPQAVNVPQTIRPVLTENVSAQRAVRQVIQSIPRADEALRGTLARQLVDMLTADDFAVRRAAAVELERSRLSSLDIASLARATDHPAAKELIYDAAFQRFTGEPRAMIGINLSQARSDVVIISSVMEDAPAGRDGLLMPGDRIVSIAGLRVERTPRPIVFSFSPGDVVTFEIDRPVPPPGIDPEAGVADGGFNPAREQWWEGELNALERLSVDVELADATRLGRMLINPAVANHRGELSDAWSLRLERASLRPVAAELMVDQPPQVGALPDASARGTTTARLVAPTSESTVRETHASDREPGNPSVFEMSHSRADTNPSGVVTLTRRVREGEPLAGHTVPLAPRRAALALAQLADRAVQGGTTAGRAGGVQEDVLEAGQAALRRAIVTARRAFWHAVIGARHSTLSQAAARGADRAADRAEQRGPRVRPANAVRVR